MSFRWRQLVTIVAPLSALGLTKFDSRVRRIGFIFTSGIIPVLQVSNIACRYFPIGMAVLQ